MRREIMFWGIVTLMAFTNPSKATYAEYLTWTLQNHNCILEKLPNNALTTCVTLGLLPDSVMQKVFEAYSYRKNYILFSVYTTDLAGLKHRSIGIAGQFIDF